MEALPVGKGRCLHQGTDVAIISIGHEGNAALEAANRLETEGISTAMYDMRYLKPLDTGLLDSILAQGYRRIVTVEDGVKKGGLGSAVLEYFATVKSANPSAVIPPVTVLGIPDQFVTHGPVAQLHKDCGIDLDSILAAARK
ncbi:MAG: hypothetical protein J6W88_06130 [Bacteroidales bacterium]|nr:hypothetical protein [Bacteroidales bacterium]